MSLKDISLLSRKFGSDPKFVLGGGGNTSFKDDAFLYIKPSGIKLANMYERDFVKLERSLVKELFGIQYNTVKEREEQLKTGLLRSVCDGSGRRPSIETPLHEVIPFSMVVHLHPALINGMTCAKNGEKACKEIFPDALWVAYTTPGLLLAQAVKNAIDNYYRSENKYPKVIFLQNHGVFVGADTREEIENIYSQLLAKIEHVYKTANIPVSLKIDEADYETVYEYAPVIKGIMTGVSGEDVNVTAIGRLDCVSGPLTPDHIVHIQSFPLICDDINKEAFVKFRQDYGYLPKLISIKDKAVFAVGSSLNSANLIKAFTYDALLIKQLTEAFGGINFIPDEERKFIENWEVEAFRKKIASGPARAYKRLQGKVAIVTGGAQGFGKGIAEGLIKEGATVCIADMNIKGAENTSDEFCRKYGDLSAFAQEVNVTDEDSVSEMIRNVINLCGGIDVFISNAGVLKAGKTTEFEKKDWEFVTNVNYTGYFICVKHTAAVMAKQNKFSGRWTDIIQINSKSGLAGSNKNAAYAGSKFGSIGLTQSFALEFVENNIKVNSICPGNFFDGPLWSDPEKGLFKQYLESGKVPDAKTIDDVKRFYESKVPMRRGCYPHDVVKAILYVIEQKYETGQAIPVTGGQIMLS